MKNPTTFCALAATLILSGSAQATKVWNKATNPGDWSVGTNWTLAGIPAITDDVELPALANSLGGTGGQINIPTGVSATAERITATGGAWTVGSPLGLSLGTLELDAFATMPELKADDGTNLNIFSPITISGDSGALFQAGAGSVITVGDVTTLSVNKTLRLEGAVNLGGTIDHSSGATNGISVIGSGSVATVADVGGEIITGSVKIATGASLTIGGGSAAPISSLDMVDRIQGDGSVDLSATSTSTTLAYAGQIRPRQDSGADGSAGDVGASLNFEMDVTSTGATWLIDVDTDANTGDQIVGAGSIDVSGSTLTLTDYGAGAGGGDIVLFSGTSVTGTFSTINGDPLPAGYSIFYRPTEIVLAIPEMGTTLPLLAILTPCFFARRRNRKQVEATA